MSNYAASTGVSLFVARQNIVWNKLPWKHTLYSSAWETETLNVIWKSLSMSLVLHESIYNGNGVIQENANS
jgi:hypothetical protein